LGIEYRGHSKKEVIIKIPIIMIVVSLWCVRVQGGTLRSARRTQRTARPRHAQGGKASSPAEDERSTSGIGDRRRLQPYDVDAGRRRPVHRGHRAAPGHTDVPQRHRQRYLSQGLRAARRRLGHGGSGQQRRQLPALLHDESPVPTYLLRAVYRPVSGRRHSAVSGPKSGDVLGSDWRHDKAGEHRSAVGRHGNRLNQGTLGRNVDRHDCVEHVHRNFLIIYSFINT